MIASEIITEEIPPLTHLDTGEKALIWMDEFKVSHLPVLKNSIFVGLLSENDVLDKMDETQSLDVLFEHLPRPFVLDTDHISEAIAKAGMFKISVIPVLNKDEKYIGCISAHKLIQAISYIGGLREQGGIIVLEMNKIDYSLAQIAQIVESNNAKILSSFLLSLPDSTKIEVTLKINEIDLVRIIRTFERYDYIIKASFHKSNLEDGLQNRFDALMNFMNL